MLNSLVFLPFIGGLLFVLRAGPYCELTRGYIAE